MAKAQITEWQSGVAEPKYWPLGSDDPAGLRGRVSRYHFAGMQDGLHVFIDRSEPSGTRELFRRVKSPPSGRHLRRGNSYYEFVRDAGPDRSAKMAERVARFVPNGVPRWIHVYDNGGRSADRYTVVFTGRYRKMTGAFWHLAMSEAPFHPQGVGMHGESEHTQIDWPTYGHLGKKIKFHDLPEDCQKAVMQDYCYLWDLDRTVAREIVEANRPAKAA